MPDAWTELLRTPTVFADVTAEMRVFQRRSRPVLCITPFRDEEHAIELANATASASPATYSRPTGAAHGSPDSCAPHGAP